MIVPTDERNDVDTVSIICQRWANDIANKTPTLAQHMTAIMGDFLISFLWIHWPTGSLVFFESDLVPKFGPSSNELTGNFPIHCNCLKNFPS